MTPQRPASAGRNGAGGDDLSGLVRRARDGDRDAWDEVVDRCLPALWDAAVGMGLTPGDAGNAVEITWLRLLDDGGEVVGPADVEGWLVSTCRTEARRLLATGGAARARAVVEVGARPTLA